MDTESSCHLNRATISAVVVDAVHMAFDLMDVHKICHTARAKSIDFPVLVQQQPELDFRVQRRRYRHETNYILSRTTSSTSRYL
jgi:hypothetical protein